MKRVGMIYRWILISIILQIILLAFINNVYLPNRHADVQAVKYDEAGNYQFPEGAQKLSVSFDMSYAAYIIDGRLEIYDIKNDNSKKTILHEGKEIDFFKWLPDRNILIYSEKSVLDAKAVIQILTYDVDAGVDRTNPEIKGIPVNSTVTGIELSPLTNVIYAEIQVNEYEKQIYKYNIMNDLSYIMTLNIENKTREANYKDYLVYQSTNGKVRVRSGGDGKYTSITFDGEEISLLGVDSSDNVYIGKLDKDKKVYKIEVKSLSQKPFETKDGILLENSVLPKDIIIAPSGEKYQINEGEKTVCDLVTRKKISYYGNFVQIIKGFVVSIDNKQLSFTAIS